MWLLTLLVLLAAAEAFCRLPPLLLLPSQPAAVAAAGAYCCSALAGGQGCMLLLPLLLLSAMRAADMGPSGITNTCSYLKQGHDNRAPPAVHQSYSPCQDFRVPRELVWLLGAPGAGKVSNKPSN